MKNILVTGGFGFIGTSLVEMLLEQDGYSTIHIVDDMSFSPIVIDDYLNQIGYNSRVTFDIVTVDRYFRNIIGDTKFDQIYHLASPVGPASVIKMGGEMIRDIVNDIYLIIDYCLKYNCKLLDVSTSEVYGGGDNFGLCSEDTPKIFPEKVTIRMEYAIGKLAAEIAIINNCRVNDLCAVIIRPFNVAGHRQSIAGGFVIPRFVQQAFNNIPYSVFYDGEDIRAFTHVYDIVDGMILAMESDYTNRVYNLGNPNTKIKIKDLSHKINEILKVDNSIEFIDPQDIYGEYFARANDKYPDSTKAFEELDWKPYRTIDDVVNDYIIEYKRQKSNDTLLDEIG